MKVIIDNDLKSEYPEVWGIYWIGCYFIMYRCLAFNNSMDIILN